MRRSNLFLLLLKPVLLNWRSSSSSTGRTLKLNSLGLVGFEVVCEISLFWRLWGGWDGELLDVSIGIGGFDRCWFVRLEFAEVQVLYEVGWLRIARLAIERIHCELGFYGGAVPDRTAVGVMMERRGAMAGRAIRARSGRCERDISRVNCIGSVESKLTAALRDCESIFEDGRELFGCLIQLLRRFRVDVDADGDEKMGW